MKVKFIESIKKKFKIFTPWPFRIARAKARYLIFFFKYTIILLILIDTLLVIIDSYSNYFPIDLLEITEQSNSNSFVSPSNFDFSDFVNKLTDSIFKATMEVLHPAHVQGFLDDLIGQRMFIEIILFIMGISIFLLFFVFIVNLIFLFNKDKIIKKFDNKFITFYVKYQAFFTWISLFVIPIFIITGLFTLCHGLHWLITHQIPYESLEVDLHKFISSSLVLPITLRSNKIKKFVNNLNN